MSQTFLGRPEFISLVPIKHPIGFLWIHPHHYFIRQRTAEGILQFYWHCGELNTVVVPVWPRWRSFCCKGPWSKRWQTQWAPILASSVVQYQVWVHSLEFVSGSRCLIEPLNNSLLAIYVNSSSKGSVCPAGLKPGVLHLLQNAPRWSGFHRGETFMYFLSKQHFCLSSCFHV